MKRLLIVLAIVFSTSSVCTAVGDAADVEYKGRTHSVAWDASLYDDGTACVGCTYWLYIKNKVTGVETKIGETTQLTSTITIPLVGSYWAGVDAREGTETPTTISWSNMPEVVAAGQTWFLTWTKTLQAPKGYKHN